MLFLLISVPVAVYFFLLDIESDEDGLSVLFKISVLVFDLHVCVFCLHVSHIALLTMHSNI